MIRIKRMYEPYDKSDGYRVLVDRLWPRGIKKADAHIDEWLKDVGPSAELRRWFGHDVEKWAEFRKRYKIELKNSEAWEALRKLAHAHKTLTLLFAAKDEAHNQAVVLKEMLE